MPPLDFPKLYAHATRIAQGCRAPQNDLEDLVQHAVLRLWRVAVRYDPTVSKWETFCEIVMKREIQWRLRDTRREPPMGPIEDTTVDRRIVYKALFPKAKRLSREDRLEATRRHAQGESICSLAKAFQVNKSSMSRLLRPR